jgi:hypothetical protein
MVRIFIRSQTLPDFGGLYIYVNWIRVSSLVGLTCFALLLIWVIICHKHVPAIRLYQPRIGVSWPCRAAGSGAADPRFEVVAPERLAGASVAPREPAAPRTTISLSFGSMRRNTIRDSKLQRVGWRNTSAKPREGSDPGLGDISTPRPDPARQARSDPIHAAGQQYVTRARYLRDLASGPDRLSERSG